jgi:threonine efflux protein
VVAGIVLGVALQVAICLVGLELMWTLLPALRVGLGLAGGLWLGWLAWQSWPRAAADEDPTVSRRAARVPVADGAARRGMLRLVGRGLLTNLLNPKAIAYFLSLFALILTREVALWVKLVCAVEMVVAQALVFGLLAHTASRPRFQQLWNRWERQAGYLTAVLFGGLAVVALAAAVAGGG